MASLYQSPNMNFFEADSQSSLDFSDVVFFPENETESTLLQASKKISKTSKASTKKNKRTRNVWTPAEDLMLIELMKKHGQNWAMISSELPGRSGKQIRDRYLNKLRPNIKCGDWSVEEDELFIRLYKQAGNKWTYIASRLEGRTEEQVKNRFYSSLKKRIETDETSYKVSPQNNARRGSVQSSITSLDSLSLPEDSESESMPFSVNTLTAFDERPFEQEPVFPQSQSHGSMDFYYNSYGPADQELYSERSTTQCSVSPCHQGNLMDPTDVISYSISEPYLNKQCTYAQSFPIPQVQHDQQIDDLLSRLTNYYVESSDCAKPYGGNEMFVQGGQYASLKCNPESQLAQLNKRKNLIEFILSKTKQSIDQFKCLVPN